MRHEIKKNSNYNPVLDGDPSRDERILPIKTRAERLKFKNLWLKSKSSQGFRNWVLFLVGIETGLRASDLVRLRVNQIYQADGSPRTHIVGEKDKKTGKINDFLDIRPLHDILVKYHQWLEARYLGKWLFYKATNKRKHITPRYLYQIMRRASDKLGIANIGSHSLRKTFGYIAYQRSGNILYVMKKLNQSSPTVTLRYIDCSRESMDKLTEKIFPYQLH